MARRIFGRTWWGQAWLDALTERAHLDPNRLGRGRTYARGDRVRELSIAPGAVGALVQGTRYNPYEVIINLPAFDDAYWEYLFDMVAAEVGHLAALLDGELPPELADRLGLLPGSGELRTACSCPDWAEPCKHSAAVCYRVADLFDTDPFNLLLLRGRAKEQVLAGLRSRRQAHPVAHVGIPAVDAYRTPSAPLPILPLPPPQPGSPRPLPTEPPPASRTTGPELAELAALAAQRAWQLINTITTEKSTKNDNS